METQGNGCSKSNLKTRTNLRGSGKLFNVTLMDYPYHSSHPAILIKQKFRTKLICFRSLSLIGQVSDLVAGKRIHSKRRSWSFVSEVFNFSNLN